MWRDLVEALLLSSLALPAVALAGLGLSWLLGLPVSEGATTRVSVAATGLSAIFTVAGAASALCLGHLPVEFGPWPWFSVGHYTFSFTLRWDAVSLVMAVGTSVLSGLVVGFSVPYLHREKGVFRYFLLMLVFATAMQWLVVAGSYDQLFLGWELVGLTSILLVAFFNDRARPVNAAVRVMVVYKLADLGLLIGAVVMHQVAHGTDFSNLHQAHLTEGQATALALLLLLAASGKAAQLPFGTWLPRAMEGPTPSSAVFYGALSVHAGIYLLIRSAPLFQQSTVASVAAVLMGGATAFAGAMLSRVQADAKTSLAWASMSQLGLMVVEVGLHLPTVALVHLIGHASLRGYQMLRAPNLLHDTIALRKALGVGTLSFGAHPVQGFLYRALRDGLFIDVVVERHLIRPVLSLGHTFERLEQRVARRLGGAAERKDPRRPSLDSIPRADAPTKPQEAPR
ncbi:MAG: proton-conducting transporter membrane subunit [Myxococcota bacterium]